MLLNFYGAKEKSPISCNWWRMRNCMPKYTKSLAKTQENLLQVGVWSSPMSSSCNQLNAERNMNLCFDCFWNYNKLKFHSDFRSICSCSFFLTLLFLHTSSLSSQFCMVRALNSVCTGRIRKEVDSVVLLTLVLLPPLPPYICECVCVLCVSVYKFALKFGPWISGHFGFLSHSFCGPAQPVSIQLFITIYYLWIFSSNHFFFFFLTSFRIFFLNSVLRTHAWTEKQNRSFCPLETREWLTALCTDCLPLQSVPCERVIAYRVWRKRGYRYVRAVNINWKRSKKKKTLQIVHEC